MPRPILVQPLRAPNKTARGELRSKALRNPAHISERNRSAFDRLSTRSLAARRKF